MVIMQGQICMLSSAINYDYLTNKINDKFYCVIVWTVFISPIISLGPLHRRYHFEEKPYKPYQNNKGNVAYKFQLKYKKWFILWTSTRPKPTQTIHYSMTLSHLLGAQYWLLVTCTCNTAKGLVIKEETIGRKKKIETRVLQFIIHIMHLILSLGIMNLNPFTILHSSINFIDLKN
jgi:hypothetical protein